MTFSLGQRAASAGYRLAAFDSIGSTNAEAIARARGGEPGPMWFVTSEQTAGRGPRTRPWIAPRGNLACSILEVIDVPPAVAATLGFAAGLALEAALQKVSVEASLRSAGSEDMKFSLKWPNDVLAGRQKLVGIGLEAEAVADNRLAVVGGTGRQYRGGGIVRGAVGLLGAISRYLGPGPRLWRDPAALARTRGRTWTAGRDPHRRHHRGRDIRYGR